VSVVRVVLLAARRSVIVSALQGVMLGFKNSPFFLLSEEVGCSSPCRCNAVEQVAMWSMPIGQDRIRSGRVG
jgi:hypothetical protein